MSELVGNPEDRFSRAAAHLPVGIELTLSIYHQLHPTTGGRIDNTSVTDAYGYCGIFIMFFFFFLAT